MSTRNMRTCENCGALRDPNATFCGNCGKPFTVAASEENNPTITFNETRRSRVSQTSGATLNAAFTPHPISRPASNLKYLVVIGVLIVLLVGTGSFELGQVIKGSQQVGTNGTSGGANSGATSLVQTTGPGCPTAGGYFKIMNMNSGMALIVPGGSLDSNSSIQQLPYTGRPEQLWQFVETGNGNGNFKILNVNSGQVLDEPNAMRTINLEIHQFPYNGGTNQLWRCKTGANGSYKIVNVNSGLVLDEPNTSDYAPLIQDQEGQGANQQWQLQPVTSSAPGCPTSGASYKIVNVGSGLALDEPNTSSYAPLLLDRSGAGAYQQWQFTPVGKGNFKIINMSDSMALDVPDGSLDSNISIQQMPYNGGLDQQWQCVSVGRGIFKLVNANSDQVMDGSGGSSTGTIEIRQNVYYGGSNQQWKFV
jgi:RNA polymerase subunit RPABC4/transcription elongation factor Spt4